MQINNLFATISNMKNKKTLIVSLLILLLLIIVFVFYLHLVKNDTLLTFQEPLNSDPFNFSFKYPSDFIIGDKQGTIDMDSSIVFSPAFLKANNITDAYIDIYHTPCNPGDRVTTNFKEQIVIGNEATSSGAEEVNYKDSCNLSFILHINATNPPTKIQENLIFGTYSKIVQTVQVFAFNKPLESLSSFPEYISILKNFVSEPNLNLDSSVLVPATKKELSSWKTDTIETPGEELSYKINYPADFSLRENTYSMTIGPTIKFPKRILDQFKIKDASIDMYHSTCLPQDKPDVDFVTTGSSNAVTDRIFNFHPCYLSFVVRVDSDTQLPDDTTANLNSYARNIMKTINLPISTQNIIQPIILKS